ncbi:alkaline phosphatase [Corynebacterium sp.]|uniref:alkaline phosphatase n=1 Tax=Corynebacterium sp. TaxID=1720 RepID=UPI0026DD183D|nr:alkaline phosphatase [Corynebacterium sp.]MDO5032068.1 alkaline phosphatase [Corynebacterium sp.]
MAKKLTGLRAGSAALITATLVSTGAAAPALAQEATGPKNIIFMIGDGMGYGHIALNNLFETGQSKYTVEGPFAAEGAKELEGKPVQAFEDFERLSMSTFPKGGSYDPQKAWATHEYVTEGKITDSAAAGTALATGMKTKNGVVGKSDYGHAEENISERAKAHGKAAGVVTSVPFSDATPATFAAHNMDRNDHHAIAKEMLNSDLDLVMGGGHPLYDNDNQKLATPAYDYISEEDFAALQAGNTDWTFFDSNDDFKALAEGNVKEDTKYWGLPQVGSTLQTGRAGESTVAFEDPMNDVVDLATMTTGALNVLGQDEDGFSVMIEGGAIDWNGHGNNAARDIEEIQDFNKSVEAAIAWVEKNSSWDETLLIVTADHETGYLSGADEPAQGQWNAMAGKEDELAKHGWYSGNHTNQLVPFFYKGAGSADIESKVVGTDPVRGEYIDNVTVADLVKTQWWIGSEDDDSEGSNESGNNSSEGSSLAENSVAAGFTGAGITAALIGLVVAAAQALGVLKIDMGALNKLIERML